MALRSGQALTNPHLFLALFICAVALLVISVTTRYLVPVEAAFRWLTYPIVYITQLPTTTKEAAGSYVVSLDELHTRNDELLREVSRLNATIAELAHAQARIGELETALSYMNDNGHNLMLTEILQVNPSRQRQEVTINRGARDGVVINDGILDPWGLYGRIVEVFPTSSRVMQLNDERHATPVLVRRTRQYFIASGNGSEGPLTLDNVNLSSDIQVGDALLTSGLGGLFPEGLYVGDVATTRDVVSESVKQVTVIPAAQLGEKAYLFVVRSGRES